MVQKVVCVNWIKVIEGPGQPQRRDREGVGLRFGCEGRLILYVLIEENFKQNVT